ncbi:DUF6270 domain-containing protein [Pseudomonas sp. NPDC090233]|uniref:DUF6270 domain-containing protein n=1 Tax=Pseudomonas sp. NPDC090233 TaxID=3364479 RepID=UPI00383A301B
MSKSLLHYVFTNFGVGIKDELWISYRLELFLNTLLVSLEKQSNRHFEWIIFIDDGLPYLHKTRLEARIAETGLNAKLQPIVDHSLVNQAVAVFLSSCQADIVLTTRIDDDDCIREDVISLLQEQACSTEHAEDLLLISLNNGMELLPSNDCCRPVAFDTLALALSLADRRPGPKRQCITQYASQAVVETLKSQGLSAKHVLIGSDYPLYLYTKHPLSDSYFFGARARILADPNKVMGLSEQDFLGFGLTQQRMSFLSALLKQSPLGMPYKHLQKLGSLCKQITAEINPATQDNAQLNALLAQKAKLERVATRPNPAAYTAKKIRVAILGSCVTRDLFEFQKNTLRDFEICFYMARSSVVSWMAPPCFDDGMAIDHSSFEGKRSHWDKLKLHWQLLEESRPDIVLIDFIDERLGIIHHHNSIVTASTPILEALQRTNTEHEVKRPWSKDVEQLREWALPAFLGRVSHICPNIFVHNAVWATQYKENDAVNEFAGGDFERQIELNNSVIEPMLASLDNIAIGIEQIGGRDAGLIAGGDHKWAFCPYHYDSAYYKTVAKQLIARTMH